MLAVAREDLAAGRLPTESFEDAVLLVTAQQAELARRSTFRAATLAIYLEQRPPEWWTTCSPEAVAANKVLLDRWNEEKEAILSELPLADRRRLESLTAADFERPGGIDPLI